MSINTNIAVWLITNKKIKSDLKPPTDLKIFRITTVPRSNEGFHKLCICTADSSYIKYSMIWEKQNTLSVQKPSV